MHWNGVDYVLKEPAAPDTGKLLYKLPELLARPDDVVFIVEGEQCADVLECHGVLATTSGGSNSASVADWSPLEGRRCVVWPDNDEPGSDYAEAVVDELLELGCDVRTLDIPPGLPDKGDVVDWLEGRPDATASDILALPTSMPISERAAPEPLCQSAPPMEPYPIDELGPILAPAARAIRRVIQAPDAICAAAVLGVASLATQGFADVHMDTLTVPLSAWFVSVAESGERKTAVDKIAMRPVHDFEHDAISKYREEAASYKAKRAEYELRSSCEMNTAKTEQGKGLAASLRALGASPEPPLRPMRTVSDFTCEGLVKTLHKNVPSIGVFSDEAGIVFGGHGMSKENALLTAATLSKLWDSGAVDRVRAGDESVKIFGKRLAMHLMVQPVIAARVLTDELLSGQGFLSRCLLAYPKSTAGTRRYVGEDLSLDPSIKRYNECIYELLSRELPVRSGTNELAPRIMTLTPDAKCKWQHFFNRIEEQQAPDGDYAPCKPWASKAGEQILRIAGVLALISNAEASTITADTIVSAAIIVGWHLDQTLRISQNATISIIKRNAQALLDWCHENHIRYLYPRKAMRLGPVGTRRREAFDDAIEALEGADWASPMPNGMGLNDGQHSEVWKIVRAPA